MTEEDIAVLPSRTDVAALRRRAGDDCLRRYCITPQRLAEYLDGVRAIVQLRPDNVVEAAAELLDADRNFALRVWDAPNGAFALGSPDPARALASTIAALPALAERIGARVGVDEFAATHLKLLVCVRGLLLAAGEQAGEITAAYIERLYPGSADRSDADGDFVVSLAVVAEHRETINAAFSN